jgi:uncharacterized protein (DUF697 family)
MTNQSEKISEIIKNHVAFSMLAGAVPIPVLDVIGVTAVQVDMIRQIAQEYGAEFDKNAGKSIVTALTGTSIARMGASAIKAIPGVGSFIGISSQIILSGATTYGIGKLFDYHFANNGTLFDIDTDSIKSKFDEWVKEGKEFASKLNQEEKTESPLETLERLNRLKESGVISEQEYEALKKKIIDEPPIS